MGLIRMALQRTLRHSMKVMAGNLMETNMDPKEILKYVRKVIRDYAGDDPDKWFLANRHVHQRLHGDERKTAEKIKNELLKSNPICHYCKEKLKVKKGIHIHRLDDNRGYSLENCVLMHQKCHEQYHKENASGRGPEHPSSKKVKNGDSLILKKESQPYEDKFFLYWWDISHGFFERKYEAVDFVRKDSRLKCRVSTAVLKEFLTEKRKTSRGNGHWGIKVLKGREGELAFEPPSGSKNWLFLKVEWLSNND